MVPLIGSCRQLPQARTQPLSHDGHELAQDLSVVDTQILRSRSGMTSHVASMEAGNDGLTSAVDRPKHVCRSGDGLPIGMIFTGRRVECVHTEQHNTSSPSFDQPTCTGSRNEPDCPSPAGISMLLQYPTA